MGPWRIGLNVSRGTGFEGGHLEDQGLSPQGQVVSVPAHRHAVELDFVRYELVASYRFAEDWDSVLRVPYDVKERRAKVELVDPATPAEIAAMQSNLDIHHPTETLEGLGDFSLLFARRETDFLRDGDVFVGAIGTSLPVGRTEEDPYVLGDAGLPHEHVQFGTGTFDPLLEFHYHWPLSERLDASANVQSKFPLYENREGYRGPVVLSSVLALSLAPTDRVALRAGWSFHYQGYARWDGERDVNSGIVSSGIVGGARYRIADGVSLSLDARVPVSQETLSDDGDTFEQGTVLQLGLSYSF